MSIIDHKKQCSVFAENISQLSHDVFGIVYVIRNLDDGKLYIGSTINYQRRVSEYIRISQLTDSNLVCRSIEKSIISLGINHFKMSPLKYCTSEIDLAYWELYYIRKYNTLVPNGYNESFNTTARSIFRGTKRKYPTGIKPSADNRRKRSRPIIAISLEDKRCIFSDSIKLLADVVYDCDRSILSNYATLGKPIYSTYFIYLETLLGETANYGEFKCDINGDAVYKQLISELRANKNKFLTENNFSIQILRYTDTESGFSLESVKC